MMQTQPTGVTRDERLWAMLAHLFGFLGYAVTLGQYVAPLIVYLVYKDKSKFVAFHALQSLYFQLAMLVVTLVLIVPSIFCLFIPLMILGATAIIYPIVLAVQAYNGETSEYWLVGSWARGTVGI